MSMLQKKKEKIKKTKHEQQINFKLNDLLFSLAIKQKKREYCFKIDSVENPTTFDWLDVEF